MSDEKVNLWQSAEHALGHLRVADNIPHRTEGERTLLEFLPPTVSRVLDLGSGDGRLLALVKLARPGADAVAVDFSEVMLQRLQARFSGDASVRVVRHDLDRPLPQTLGSFDVIVSSFAIHHVVDDRKRTLYEEAFRHLNAGGAFCNLEHVASPTRALHDEFVAALGLTPDQDDPSNKLLDVETQLS